MKKIAILGAGWLGKPLAEKLKLNGHQIKVSTTSQEKSEEFNKKEIQNFIIRINNENIDTNIDLLLNETEILIITVPPGRTQNLESDYVSKIKTLIPYIEKHNIKEVIFTSSTTVYISLRGNVDESTKIVPQSDMDKQIYEIEQLLLNHPEFNSTIIRLGGLIGEDRHPVQYIVKSPVINDANNPVNMVHRNDIIRFLEKMVVEPIENDIYNIVAPIELNRRDFYTREANKLGLHPIPEFIDNENADLRKVSGQKIVNRYKIEYQELL